VYEWEAPGEGCALAAGCVFLISDGLDDTEGHGLAAVSTASAVELLGADRSGDNVFFATVDQLVGQDDDTQLDYYDARVDGGFPRPVEPAGCSTSETCHEEGTAPGIEPSLGSSILGGPGNLKPLISPPPPPKKVLTPAQLRAEKLTKALKACHKDKRHEKRARCEKAARRKYGPVKKAKPKKKRGK
jgi:hypothetical protein